MNISKMKKNDLIDELKKRGLPQDGLKDELKSRLMEAIEHEEASIDGSETDNKSIKSDLSNIEENDSDLDKYHDSDMNNLKKSDPEIPVLTLEDTINMKEMSTNNESDSLIVNAPEEDYNENEENKTLSENKDSSIIPTKIDTEINDHEVLEVNENDTIDEDNVDKSDNKDEINEQEETKKETKDESCVSDSDTCLSKEQFVMVVKNIPVDTKAIDLKTLFADHAKIKTARILKNANEDDACQFGNVVFEDLEEMLSLIQKFNGTQFRGKNIILSNKAEQDKTIVAPSSPVSSSDSWGGTKKNNSPKCHNPLNSPKKKIAGWGDSDDEKDICKPAKYSPEVREKSYDNDFPKREFGRQRRDFRGRGGGRRGGYQGDRGGYQGGRGVYRGDRFGNDINSRSFGGSRDYDKLRRYDDYDHRSYKSRDSDRYDENSYKPRNFIDKRDRVYDSNRGGRDDYRKSRDDFRGYRDDYRERSRGREYDNRSKYDRYESKEREYKRNTTYDKSKDYNRDNLRFTKNEYVQKRSRNDDDMYSHKRRREDFSVERRGKYRISPAKQFETERSDYRKNEFRAREPENYRNPKPDYPRKVDEYSNRRSQFSGAPNRSYSPNRRNSRPKDRDHFQIPQAEFGGRSRHYD